MAFLHPCNAAFDWWPHLQQQPSSVRKLPVSLWSQSPSPFQRVLRPRRWRHQPPLKRMGSWMTELINTDQNWCPSQTCLLMPNLHSALLRMSSPNCAVLTASYAYIMHLWFCWCSWTFPCLVLDDLVFLAVILGSWYPLPVLWKRSNRRKYNVQLPGCW